MNGASPTDTADAATIRSAGQRVTRGAFAILSTQPLTWATTLALAVLVPRYLGDAALGTYGISGSIAALVANLASFGLQNLLARRVATEPDRAAAYAWGGVFIVGSASAAIGLALLVVANVLQVNSIDPAVTAMALYCAFLGGIQGVMLSTLIGLGRNARVAWSSAGIQLFVSVVGIATLLLGASIYEYAFSFVLSTTVATLVVLWLVRFPIRRSAFEPALLRELIVGGLPFLGWSVALRVRSGLDIIITGILLQAHIAGWLVAAYRIINVTVFIPTVVMIPLLPALTQSKSRLDQYRALLSESLATVILLTVPVSASIVALAPAIPGLIGWPQELQNAVPVMTILAFQQPLVAIDMVLGTSLVALGLERRWLKVAVLGALFNPLLNVVVIPLAQSWMGNGAVGAAMVELATEVLFLFGAVRLTQRGLLGREDLGRAARIVGAGIALALVASAALPLYGPAAAFLLGGLAYLGAAFALGVLRPHQIRAMRLALRGA